MHPSYFRILNVAESDPDGDLSLSAETSEWLFYIKFWDALNSELGSNFGQYEDDVLPKGDVDFALKSIVEVADQNLAAPFENHNIVYGWNDRGDRLEFSISGDRLASDITCLSTFLKKALDLESDVYCQL